jgi:hypothetical protein
MMQNSICRVMVWLALLTVSAGAFPGVRAQDRPNSFSLFGTFTTSSKLFHHPNDPDEQLRSEFLPFDDLFSAGVDFRRSFSDLRLQIGLSIEYLTTTNVFDLPAGTATLRVTDGFTVYPVELTGYFHIPVGSEKIKLFMGGGGGMYVGERVFEYNGVYARPTEHPLGFGIHIVSGMEYFLNPLVSVRGDIKFRDVQFQTTNRFSPGAVVADPSFAYVGGTSPFSSRISVDGMAMHVGVAYHF